LVEEDEIEIDNQLFDIVWVHQEGESIKLILVADHAENKMKRTLSGLQKEKTGWSQFAQLAQSYAFSLFHPESTLIISRERFALERVYFNAQENLICKGNQNVPEQPPAI
jgi:hypothetical protein